MGRHHKTNEVFVLDRGEADMVICENGDKPGEAHVIKMEQGVAYNVLQNVWHAVVMSRDAHIIIFEKSDTSAENTEYVELDEEVIDACKKQFASGKKKKAKKKKAKKSGRKGKAASSEDAANDPIQQLTLWPEFQ